MSVEVKSLGHGEPATPKCKTRNNYCGVTVAQAVEAAGPLAVTKALDAAKGAAQEALNRAANRRCPNACTTNAVYEGDNEPAVKQFGPFEDAVDGKFVAYAVAYWKRAARCFGDQEEQIPLALGSSAEVFHYVPGDPVCRKRRLYTGCVISKVIDPLLSDATTKAQAKALDEGRPLLRDDRRKECPKACQPSTGVGPHPDNLAAESFFDAPVPLFQMKTEPYAAFAVTQWAVTIECP
jgi:hypothetical protein